MTDAELEQCRQDGALLRSIVSRRVKLKREGREWKGLCPFHNETDGSFTVYEDGHFHCYGCNRHGTVVDWFMFSDGVDTAEAIRRVAQEAGISEEPARPRPKPKSSPKPNGNGSHAGEMWQPIMPPPSGAPAPTEEQLRCDWVHEYCDSEDRLLCYVRRIEAKNGKRKLFLPLTFGVLDGKRGWHVRAPDAPKPLYRLNALSHAAPDAVVLLCEGEKAAEAAQRLLPAYVGMSWMGGVNGDNSADLAPLAGHRVILWGDADEVGRQAILRLAKRLAELRPRVRVSWVITDGLPVGYDAADLEHDDPESAEDWLRERIQDPPAGEEFNPEDWLIITDEPWDPDALPPRPWVASPYLMREEITLLHGPGGHGKSQLCIAWAVALALGRSFGRLMPAGRFRVLLANFEDGKLEQMRRISAMLAWFGATPADLQGWLYRVSLGPKGDATMFEVGEKDGVIRTTQVWDALEEACLALRPDVVIGDPLVAISAVPENDNQLIRRVMATLKIGMAQRFNCALVVAHHDVKAGGTDEDSDQTNARGAGDIVNAARFELAVKKMSVDQSGQMNIRPERRGFYFRLGSAASKLNYVEAMDAEWFQRFARPIGVGAEQTVYCEPWDPKSTDLGEDAIEALLSAIGRGTRDGPYSPQLGDGRRSLTPLLTSLGVVSPYAQRSTLKDLKMRGVILTGKYKRPGHGSHIRAGLRTENGDPHNHEWQDDA